MSYDQAYKIMTLAGRFDLLSLVEKKTTAYPFYIETSQSATNTHAGEYYDILFAHPQDYLVKHSEQSIEYAGKTLAGSDFFTELDRLFGQSSVDLSSDSTCPLPFCGGWFLFLAYELAKEVEPSLKIKNFDPSLPIAFAARVPAAIIYCHKHNETHIVVENEFEQHYMQKMLLDVKGSQIKDNAATEGSPLGDSLDEVVESPADDYTNAIGKILSYIKEGDVFQVNLSRLWRSTLTKASNLSATDIFKRLRKTNPAPFSALVHYKSSSIISSSPERLVKVSQSCVETRPIAGTRPRNINIIEDNKLQSELIRNEKERAEHIMLIDLERNDLGRICKYGSVRVNEFMQVESYAHVHHIVSNVMGELKNDITPGQIIKAVFPGGTITGCPKVRCMEIILELEDKPRGAYTGSLGYLGRNGNMDLNILIRTFIMDEDICFRAGAGIVADSDPEKELEETRSKAKGLLMALKSEDDDNLS